MKLKNYTELFACPDCKGDIKNIDIDHQLLGFFCEICKLIYPVKEKIFILLSKSARNYTLEYDLVESIKKKSLNHPTEQLKQYINNTLSLLDSSKDVKSWEWEDEEFWSKEYKKEKEIILQKNWNDRIWQREVLVKDLLDKTKLNGKTILDVGCGEGQNFKSLFVDHCDESTLYIASDISLAGLKLNRLRNKHKNSLYVLCSADKLPFHREKIDILCYFGILHHTERKAGTITQDSELMKKNGHILIVPYNKVKSLEDLSMNEVTEIMKLSQESMKIMRQVMKPEGFNLGLNQGKAAGAGIDEHLHFHIVPRWKGDNNFMPATGNTKVIVQALEDTYDMLLPEYNKIK